MIKKKDIILRRINSSHIQFLIKWSEDKITQKYLSGMLPLDKFVNFLLAAENRLTYFAFLNEKAVGMMDIEFYPKEKSSAMSLLVAPEERQKGFGKILLEKTIQLDVFDKVNQLDAFIEPENIVSIKCFSKVGFQKINKEVDEDGMFQFSYFF